MKHKVVCSLCGKSEIIEILNRKIPNRWRYYGKLNVNACQTSKYYYKFPEGFPKKIEDWDGDGTAEEHYAGVSWGTVYVDELSFAGRTLDFEP